MVAVTVMVFNFSLNLLVIVSLIYYPRTRRHVTTPFIISLSFYDLVYAGIILPVYAARFSNRESPLSEGLCKFFPVIFYGTMGSSLISLTVVSPRKCERLLYFTIIEKLLDLNRNDDIYPR